MDVKGATTYFSITSDTFIGLYVTKTNLNTTCNEDIKILVSRGGGGLILNGAKSIRAMETPKASSPGNSAAVMTLTLDPMSLDALPLRWSLPKRKSSTTQFTSAL
ncbi:hypothetical protein L1987_02288 [Smallanthus sonchifolius]|uniref:Uncharacterized protein n=1 Tax=Smallanthus sonchifolius TaxID=185202 RepID=A0ACB9K7L6_9ASTR|nr:hypothetical protein L1987_02288 [Smallanthus sonchifolius]